MNTPDQAESEYLRQQEEQRRQQLYMADLYRQIFDVDKRGYEVMEDLVKRFSKPAVAQGGIDAVLKTYLNQGEHNVIQHILRQISIANNVGAEDENQ